MPRSPGKRPSGHASLSDVAALAGVSAQTVSRVVNGAGNVLPDTREKVESALTALGYRPHTAARALATGKFGSIGVLCFDLTKFGNLHVVDAAIHEAQANGYGMYLSSMPDATDADLQAAVRGLTDRAVDGLVLVEARILDTPHLRLPAGLPTVVAEGARDAAYATVAVDHAAGARLAVEHLLELGHRTVHHISGPPSSHSTVARLVAWRQALEDHGAHIPEPTAGDWSAASGYRAARELFDRARRGDIPRVTAIFAANDEMAAGVLRAAVEDGIAVPHELSVVGYDDTEFAGYLTPPLTTVRPDLRRVGRRCVERLLMASRADTAVPATAELVVPELVVRASTSAPPQCVSG
ncbi:LacI family DNA-binding transcriptional regulator [Nocardia miyunensis]|uniref:LacI family DNA-binding transcriptional regulator n=1 Tax=Nocardia miyunensis TaxID=282684 RepID=UPI000829D698|nr:LacI family DNA-binding transcriptional regulator [Nocardia miyunensis]